MDMERQCEIDLSVDELTAIEKRERDLKQLIHQSEFEAIQENGQRKIGGPPANWNGPAPPKGCEIFIGRLPRNVFEQELYQLFSTIGPIYELRLMMDFSGTNRGFAFITYTNRHDATRAVQELGNYELRPRHKIGVLKSIDNCRLFVGGIPKEKTQEEVRAEMERLTEGVSKVIVYSSITDKTRNRGFAFVEYINHRAASKARRKLIPERVMLWGRVIAVDWAEPEPDVDEEIMSRVTVLYVRNLTMTTTEQMLCDLFNSVSNHAVQKVKMMRDFAFVHFANRDVAQMAMDQLNHKILNGSKIEITWAKPVLDKDNSKQRTRVEKPVVRKTSLSSMASSNSAKSYGSSPPNLSISPVTNPSYYMQPYSDISPVQVTYQTPSNAYGVVQPYFPDRNVVDNGQNRTLFQNHRQHNQSIDKNFNHDNRTREFLNMNIRRQRSFAPPTRGLNGGSEVSNEGFNPMKTSYHDHSLHLAVEGLNLTESNFAPNPYHVTGPDHLNINVTGPHFVNPINGNNYNNYQFPAMASPIVPARFSDFPLHASQRIHSI